MPGMALPPSGRVLFFGQSGGSADRQLWVPPKGTGGFLVIAQGAGGGGGAGTGVGGVGGRGGDGWVLIVAL